MNRRTTPLMRERIDAETARELLAQKHPHEGPETGTDRDAKLFWLIQQRIIAGGHNAGIRPPDHERWSARASKLAELHTQVYTDPNNLTAHTERDALLHEIQEEALQELHQIEAEVASGKRASMWENP